MHAISKMVTRVGDVIDRVMRILSIIMLSALVIVITLQVIFRFFFTAFSWSEEVSRFLLVYLSMFGAALAYRLGSHISIRLFHDKLSPKAASAVGVVVTLLSILFFVLTIIYSIELIARQQYQVSGALRVPMQYIYLAIPISISVMIIFALEQLAKDVMALKAGKETA